MELLTRQMKAKAQSIDEMGSKPILLQQILLFLVGELMTFCNKH